MGIVRSGWIRWGVLLALAGVFLVLQHVAHGYYYEGVRYSYYVEPDLQDPALKQAYQDRGRTLYGWAIVVGGAFAVVLLAPIGNTRSRGGSTLSRPRTALIVTSVTLLLTALFGVAYYGLGRETFIAWGPTFANYYFLLPALILHLAFFPCFRTSCAFSRERSATRSVLPEPSWR